MNTRVMIASIVRDAFKKAIADGKLPACDIPDVKVEYPKEQKFGDYSTPIALESSKILRRSPMDTGAVLKDYIEKSEIISEVEVARPGFINVFLSFDHIYGNMHSILSDPENCGRSVKDRPRRINVEFVSANPTGPLVIVSARAAALGDALANLIEMSGDIVEREFYVNDYGNQVDLFGKSVLARMREIQGKPFVFPEDGYQGEYVRDIARKILDECGPELDAITGEEDLIATVAQKAIDHNIATQQRDMHEFNVDFKTWFRERKLHENGDVMAALDFLAQRNVIYEQDGKKVFSSTAYGDDKDRVVVRDDGRPTYLLADIAYHLDKIKRGYDLILDIWGPDHHGYIARLSGAMTAMGHGGDSFRVLIAQQVNLIMEGEAVKMSKRLGKFSTMRDLIDEIGVDVARYFFTMRSMDSHLDFDLALAKKESSENPVFYLQYAHARICSLFREAEKRGVTYDPSKCRKEYLDNPEGIALMKLMLKFNEEIVDAAQACEPHRMCSYLMKLAQSFHRFYTDHRFLSDDREQTNSYLTLADAVKAVMKQGLRIVGVSAPERM
ncbi:MAG TPA: arginine--tRNA ligase [Spirochaetota bacterium]|nr:arginine--tRNA ligase [Spirochaetota bacterium]